MLRRLTMVSFVLLSLAFAPAPVYRPERDRSGMSMAQFQGTWKVAGHHNWAAGKKQRNSWTVTHIRVQKDQWTLLEANRELATYRIELHARKKPCHIDWRGKQGEALWLGLIRRDGDIVEVIYRSATERPGNFAAPADGSVLITLQRGR